MAACRLNGFWCLYSRGKFRSSGREKTPMAIGRQFCAVAALACALLAVHSGPRAQPVDFPNRTVRFIVPFAPGGGVDIVARLVAPKLAELWGQPVIVENKAGAVGTVASEYVMHQPADGYTVLIGVVGSHAIAQYPQSEARLRSGARFCRRHRARLLAADLSRHPIVAVPHDQGAGRLTPRPIRCCSAVPAPVRRCI